MKIRNVVLSFALICGIQFPASAGEGWAIVHWFKQGATLPQEAPSCFGLASEPFRVTYPGERPRGYAIDRAKIQFIDYLHNNQRSQLDKIVSPQQRLHYGSIIVKATKAEVEADAQSRGYLEADRRCPAGSEKIRVSMAQFTFDPWSEGSGFGGLTRERYDTLNNYLQGK